MKNIIDNWIKYLFGIYIDFQTRHLNLDDEDADIKKELLSLIFDN